MNFIYDENLQLISITDTDARTYTLDYNEETRIDNITDFNGDIVSFEYFGTGAIDGMT
jgi:YD repeat-containing protein